MKELIIQLSCMMDLYTFLGAMMERQDMAIYLSVLLDQRVTNGEEFMVMELCH